MIDGMDGLSGSLTLILLGSLYVLISVNSSSDLIILSCLTYSVIAFLLFNLRIFGRKTASIFLGDAGSTLIGLFISWFVIKHSQGENQSFTPVIALWLVAIPLFDTVGVLLRRCFRGLSPFKADRNHTHHLLLDLGWGVNKSLFFLVIVSALFAVIGIVSYKYSVAESTLFYIFIGLFIIYLGLMEWGERHIKQ